MNRSPKILSSLYYFVQSKPIVRWRAYACTLPIVRLTAAHHTAVCCPSYNNVEIVFQGKRIIKIFKFNATFASRESR